MSFSVVAEGTEPLSYQWSFNGTNLAEATDAVLVLTNVQWSDAGAYSVVVTNGAGSANSTDGVLTVYVSLAASATAGGTVSKSPDQVSFAPDDVVTLTATADLGYEFIGWSGDADGTNNPLAVTMTTNKSIVANFSANCLDMILDNTNAAVTFVGDWETGLATSPGYGPDYRFASVDAGGFSNATYRPYICTPGYYDVSILYPEGANWATNAPWSVVYAGGSISVPVNQQVNGGTWVTIGSALLFEEGTNGYVRVSNDAGFPGFVVADAVRFTSVGAISTNLILTATASGGGAVYKYPDQTEYEVGSVVSLIPAPVLGWSFSGWSGDASGSADPLTVTLYESLRITANFDSTVADLIVDNTQTTATGTWTTRAGTGYYGSDFQTASTTRGPATAAKTFTPTIVTGGNYDVYAWYPTPISGTTSTNAQYMISFNGGTTNVAVNQQSHQQAWRLLASGVSFAPGTSGFVRLSNNTRESNRRVLADAVRWVYSAKQSSPPAIITQPQDQTSGVGGTAVFTSLAVGTAPLSYQWQFNGVDISGATDSAYARSNLQLDDAGNYAVVVTNDAGSVLSFNALLTVELPAMAPTIVVQPTNQTVSLGGAASFSVVAEGDAPLTYQWSFNGTRILESTDAILVVADAQWSDAGDYAGTGYQ